MDNPIDGRPFFMDLWREHRFHVDLVASRAGVSEDTILTMLRYQPIGKNDAQKVLAALSTLYRQEYTLLTVSIRLLAEEDADAQSSEYRRIQNSSIGDDVMKNQEKMWYTIEEALEYLQIGEPVFWRKMTFFHMGTRMLPGMNGTFVSRRDLLFLEQRIQTTRQNPSK